MRPFRWLSWITGYRRWLLEATREYRAHRAEDREFAQAVAWMLEDCMSSQTHRVSRKSSTAIEVFPIRGLGVRMILTNALSSSSIHLTLDPDYARTLGEAIIDAAETVHTEQSA